MNKLVVIIILTVVGLGIVGLSIWGLFSTGHKVKINLPDGVDSISINGQNKNDNQTLGIKPGEYMYYLVGENIDSTRQQITIAADSDELNITYAPYSKDYLTELLEPERSTIGNLINQEFVADVDDYKLHKIALLDRGQYAVAILTPDDIDINNPSGVYRVLLSKTNQTWQIASGPYILLTTANSKDVPKPILKAANDLAL